MTNPSKLYPLSVWLALFSVYLVWGSTYLGIRFAIETIPPLLMAGSRFLVSGSLLYVFMRLRGASRPRAEHWKSAFIISVFLILIGNGGVTWAEQKVPSGITALLVGTVPLWMVVLEYFWKGEARPGGKAWFGIFLGLAGITFLVFSRSGAAPVQVDVSYALLLIATSLAWSYGSLYARSAPLPDSAILATAMEMALGGILQLIVGFLMGEGAKFHLHQITAHSAWAWVYLGLVGSLVGFSSYIWVLQKSTPALASTYAYVNPVIAVFLGWALGHEGLSGQTLGAAALIVTAVLLITLDRGKKSGRAGALKRRSKRLIK
jgi:drug/metabolite transporter (DMT)-like permease